MKETRILFKVKKDTIVYNDIPHDLHNPIISLLKTKANIYYWKKAPLEGEASLSKNLSIKLKLVISSQQQENAIIEVCKNFNIKNVEDMEDIQDIDGGIARLLLRIIFDAIQMDASHIYINAHEGEEDDDAHEEKEDTRGERT
ncbi:hypothetical protein [Candidatus Uabimicrobium sp. HlEnr_7]|uniref:hypothetical protein n=1 Tax=Candidatus Uabimicrobium helgolandensis TaxID=3095367 RepID=UPI00355916BF